MDSHFITMRIKGPLQEYLKKNEFRENCNLRMLKNIRFMSLDSVDFQQIGRTTD